MNLKTRDLCFKWIESIHWLTKVSHVGFNISPLLWNAMWCQNWSSNLCMLVQSHGPPHDTSSFCAWCGGWSVVSMITNKKLSFFLIPPHFFTISLVFFHIWLFGSFYTCCTLSMVNPSAPSMVNPSSPVTSICTFISPQLTWPIDEVSKGNHHWI